MIPIEDMKSCIQEWFSQEYSVEGVARLYFELRYEIEKQLEFMITSLKESEVQDEAD